MMRMFEEGGWFTYVVALAGLVAVVVAIVALVIALTSEKRQPALLVAIGAMAMAIFVPVSGGVGYVIAMRQVNAAVQFADPQTRAALLAVGTSEAMNNILLGGICGAVPCLLALLALGRAATRPA